MSPSCPVCSRSGVLCSLSNRKADGRQVADGDLIGTFASFRDFESMGLTTVPCSQWVGVDGEGGSCSGDALRRGHLGGRCLL